MKDGGVNANIGILSLDKRAHPIICLLKEDICWYCSDTNQMIGKILYLVSFNYRDFVRVVWSNLLYSFIPVCSFLFFTVLGVWLSFMCLGFCVFEEGVVAVPRRNRNEKRTGFKVALLTWKRGTGAAEKASMTNVLPGNEGRQKIQKGFHQTENDPLSMLIPFTGNRACRCSHKNSPPTEAPTWYNIFYFQFLSSYSSHSICLFR